MDIIYWFVFISITDVRVTDIVIITSALFKLNTRRWSMYQALYRKWRPMTFDDVVSQKHITQTLINQVINDKTAHAYLFTGSRGTGKTTCARILAKSVNCLCPKNGNPCLECEICHDAENDALADIIEIDAASNNGVNDIRDLREGAVFTPERCRYKVYIIDEVHMLSTSAFNALLKIMEEPPPYVKFILATTEVHKVPATILSRCQRFDFKRILSADIVDRLMYISQHEEFSVTKEAAELIAGIADGGMRDALSLLDQCTAYSMEVTADIVSEASGIAGRGYLFDLAEALTDSDAGKAVKIADDLYGRSKDMQRLCEELISQFRNLMLIKTVSDADSLLACMPDENERLHKMADRLTLSGILSKLEKLQNCNERLSKSLTKRIEFEMCIIRICTENSVSGVDNSEIYGKIEKLEDKLNSIKTSDLRHEKNDTVKEKSVAKAVPNEPQADFSKLKADDFKPCAEWADILEEFSKISPGVSNTLINSHAFINGNVMLINAENAFFINLFKKQDNAQALGDAVQKVLGKRFVIRAKSSAPKTEKADKAGNLLEKAIQNGIPVEEQ